MLRAAPLKGRHEPRMLSGPYAAAQPALDVPFREVAITIFRGTAHAVLRMSAASFDFLRSLLNS